MKGRFALFLASSILCATTLAFIQSSTSGAAPATILVSIGHLGGTRTFSATVVRAQQCSWTSSPRIRGFDDVVRCQLGNVSRTANFPPNSANTAKRFTVTLLETGHRSLTFRWRVTQAGLPTTTTTTPPSTTTTLATTKIPFTYIEGSVTCTGIHIDAPGQAPEDVETCQSSGTSNAGTFASAPGSAAGLGPWGYVSTWQGDYYHTLGETVVASSWTITDVNNSNGTNTGYVDSYYVGQSA